MAIATGDILRVSARLLWGGVSDIVNVWWMEVLDDAAASLSDNLDAVTQFIEDIYTEWEANIDDNTDFADISVVNHTQNESYGAVDWPSLTTGGGVGDPEMPQASVFCFFPTFTSGIQGRKWIGGFQETNMTEGLWISGLIGNIATGLALLFDPYTHVATSTELKMKIPHFVNDGVPLMIPTFYDYVQSNISNVPGTRSSRRLGAGS
jgi:hypothetical protein